MITDNTLVFGSDNTFEEAIKDHDGNLEALLQATHEKNLKFNLAKLSAAGLSA